MLYTNLQYTTDQGYRTGPCRRANPAFEQAEVKYLKMMYRSAIDIRFCEREHLPVYPFCNFPRIQAHRLKGGLCLVSGLR